MTSLDKALSKAYRQEPAAAGAKRPVSESVTLSAALTKPTTAVKPATQPTRDGVLAALARSARRSEPSLAIAEKAAAPATALRVAAIAASIEGPTRATPQPLLRTGTKRPQVASLVTALPAAPKLDDDLPTVLYRFDPPATVTEAESNEWPDAVTDGMPHDEVDDLVGEADDASPTVAYATEASAVATSSRAEDCAATPLELEEPKEAELFDLNDPWSLPAATEADEMADHDQDNTPTVPTCGNDDLFFERLPIVESATVAADVYEIEADDAPTRSDLPRHDLLRDDHMAIETAAAAVASEELARDDRASEGRAMDDLAADDGRSPATIQLLRPASRVEGLAWPATCDRLEQATGAEIDRLCDTLLIAMARGQRVIGFRGVRAGEGGTTVLLCVARRLAARGVRLALADADATAPQIATRLGMTLSAGWESVAAGEIPLSEALFHVAAGGLTLLPARATGDAAWLDGEAVPQGLANLAANFDLVLIDLGSPAAAESTPIAPRLAAAIDTVILVHDRSHSSDAQLAAASDALAAGGVSTFGVVENFAVDAA